MAKTQTKILVNCWRDATTAGILLYFMLLILDVLIDGFVQAFIPLTVFGYVVVIDVIIYQWWIHRSTKV